MIGSLLSRLFSPGSEPEPLDGEDAKVALTALLVRVARSDHDYAAEEAERIDAIVAARYGIDPAEAKAIRSEAEKLEAEAPDTVRFTRAIKSAVPHENRETVVEALWEIVLLDGERHHEEDGLLRLVASLLGVSDKDSALARERVESRLE